jgi:hypothetical protein
MVTTEILTIGGILKLWSEVTGRTAFYVKITAKDYEKIWGVAGAELYDQFKFAGLIPDWLSAYDGVSMEELGITSDGMGCKDAFESLKAIL